MVMWTEFHPPTALVTWPCLSLPLNIPLSHSECTAYVQLWADRLNPVYITFGLILFTFMEFDIDLIVLVLSIILLYTHTYKCATQKPQETAGDVALLALSRCLQVKFTKSKWPVCFLWLESTSGCPTMFIRMPLWWQSTVGWASMQRTWCLS